MASTNRATETKHYCVVPALVSVGFQFGSSRKADLGHLGSIPERIELKINY